MVTYKFKLIESKVPVVRGRNIITDSNVGGIKNTYRIYMELRMDFNIKVPGFGARYIDAVYYSEYIGTKSFLRPYQTVWDKKEHRLPPVYWGKGPMLNMWLVLSNDYKVLKPKQVLLPDGDTTHHCTKIFNVDFLSQELTKNLNSNQSFSQSKFEKHEKQRRA